MQRAQGLLETIVAIGVIVTGLISVLALVVSNLNTQREAALRYQAINIAREGLEIIRNRRDSNWLDGRDSWDGISDGEALYIAFDPELVDTQRVLFPEVSPTLADSDQVCRRGDGILVQREDGCELIDSAPRFSRVFDIAALNCSEIDEFAGICDRLDRTDNIARRIMVTVGWQDRGQNRRINATELLYDWR